jgi:alkylation response protein AidB-like acyl-CoA dehydrogenase
VLRQPLADDALQSATRMTTVALLGEAVGTLERALEFAKQQLETRQQFGVFLREFQVLRHKAAEIYMTVRELQALGARAARACAENDPRADDLVRHAKIYVGGAGVKAAELAVQLHGAMGVTEEVPVGRCLQRLITIDSLYGNSRQHLELMAQAVDRSWT